MQSRQENRSEVARLLNQIASEYMAATRGLTGFAESAKHAAITARMENVGRLHTDLRDLVGDDATRLVVERLEALSEEDNAMRDGKVEAAR